MFSKNIVVLSFTLVMTLSFQPAAGEASPYSNKLVYQSSKLDIDHVVPLKWAWEHGAATWPKAKRIRFANDPLNLLAVEARLNRQKGAKGLQDWLPPENKCQYMNLFATIKDTYDLTYSPGEEESVNKLEGKYCK